MTSSLAASVIICTRNRPALLARTLSDLGRQVLPGDVSWEILVVDNGPDDRTRAEVDRAAERYVGLVRYVVESRPGKSFALNTGVAASRGALLAFTDDDVELDPRWLVELLRGFEDPQCQGVAGSVIPLFLSGQPGWLTPTMPFPYRFDLGDRPQTLDRPPFGANMAFRRTTLSRHGGFRTDLGPRPNDPIGGEDSEFGARVLAAGEVLRYVPSARIRHPVTKAQASKRFLRHWNYQYGRAWARRNPPTGGVATWGGVPRHLIRELGEAALGALIQGGAMGLTSQLRMCRVWGQMSEARRLARQLPSPPPSAGHGQRETLE